MVNAFCFVGGFQLVMSFLQEVLCRATVVSFGASMRRFAVPMSRAFGDVVWQQVEIQW